MSFLENRITYLNDRRSVKYDRLSPLDGEAMPCNNCLI
ncbi:hypothetical protein D1AOALGA4SA_12238 [Olavius algarvensis Delta 1 endosymbiont]|nr:hypothetical protein D1AOALGA4SA_12238 [Olavius algarvensis Delta 1 endosymbiont]